MSKYSDCITNGGIWYESKQECNMGIPIDINSPEMFVPRQKLATEAVKAGADRESQTVHKPAVTKLSPQFLECVGDVLAFGEKKYPSKPEDGGRPNWMRGLSVVETVASLVRHGLKILRGENNDKETGFPHACHVGANALFLHEFLTRRSKTYAKFDDRYFLDAESE